MFLRSNHFMLFIGAKRFNPASLVWTTIKRDELKQ